MSEKEAILRAKMYIDKLANGIDPVTDKKIPDDEVVNNVKISRCLFYVSSILQKAADGEGKTEKFPLYPQQRVVQKQDKVYKEKFRLTNADKMKIPLLGKPVSITQLVSNINSVIDTEKMHELRSYSVLDWLIRNKLLTDVTDKDGTKYKYPTNMGKNLGITGVKRSGNKGDYMLITYSQNAQKVILKNLDVIIEFNNRSKKSYNKNT